MFFSAYIASPNSIISKLWYLTSDLQVSVLRFPPVMIFPILKLLRHTLRECFTAKSTSGETSSSQGSHRVLCHSLQARNPACKPPYLPVHHLHPADKAALVKYALWNTVFCSEKFKIKILELHHRKGRITPQPPSWNECDSPLLLTCKTAIWNLVGYKMWPTSLFRFISFSQHVTWCKISSSHNTVKRKVFGYLRFLGFGFIWQYVLKHPYWHTQMAQQLLLSKCFWAVSNDFNFLISYSLYKQDCNQVTNRVMKHRVPLKKKSQKYVQKLFKHKFKKTVVSHS